MVPLPYDNNAENIGHPEIKDLLQISNQKNPLVNGKISYLSDLCSYCLEEVWRRGGLEVQLETLDWQSGDVQLISSCLTDFFMCGAGAEPVSALGKMSFHDPATSQVTLMQITADDQSCRGGPEGIIQKQQWIGITRGIILFTEEPVLLMMMTIRFDTWIQI